MPFFGVPIRNGLPIGLGSVAGFGVQQFDPSLLFEGGTVPGAWYDPSDLTTMFDTSAGTTPVAMPGQGSAVSVGLMLDKSQGLVLGSELVTNGDFSSWSGDDPVGWSINGPEDANNYVTQAGTSARLVSNGGNIGIRQTILTSGQWYKYTITIFAISGSAKFVFGSSVEAVFSTTGVKTGYIRADGNILEFRRNTACDVTFDDISIKAIPGNHAISFNNTTARPELRARVNLLVATATLSTQNVTTQATSYTLSFAGTGSITLSGTATGSYSAGTHTITCTAGTLTLTVSGTVTTADLRPANSGALLPVYQAVVDANTYDTSGFPLYLRFDGIDDSMYTPANLNLSGTDKVAVFAGVRKLSDAAVGVLAELSAARASNNGAFTMLAPGGPGANYTWASKGTADVIITGAATAPVTNTVTSIGDIGAPVATLQINGTQVANDASSQGTGNYGTYPLYIGARNNSSLWFNGHLYSLAVVGSVVSAGNIAAMESWVAGRTGIQI